MRVARSQATRSSPQPWPWPGHPRVLIEHPDEAVGLRFASILRQAGYAVAVCPGPEQSAQCPIVGPEGCAVAHGADVVVSSLGLERLEAREVLQSLQARCPDTALVVEVAPGQEAELHDLLAGCDLLDSPAVPEQLVASVGRALAARRSEL